jgi:hypothetical protein
MTEHQIHKDCKKGGKPSYPAQPVKWVKWLFALFGFFSLVWFLVRVIPKPSRATYPCMRVAAPLASSFVIWLLGLGGAIVAMRTAYRQIREIRYLHAALCLLAAGATVLIGLYGSQGPPALAGLPASAQLELSADTANDPIGVPRGYKPGRVVWVHDAQATDWEGPGNGSCWETDHIDQAVVDSMMSRAVRWLTAKPTEAQAWDALFRHFNIQRGLDRGYQAGEKIAIKINLTLCHVSGSEDPPDPLVPAPYRDKAGNTNPQMVKSLLRQLVYKAGVAQADISVGDTVTFFPQQWYDYLTLESEFPLVRYLDHNPHADDDERTAVQFSFDTPFYWSTSDADGKDPDFVPLSFAEADYVINFAVLKSHERAGITVCAKNHYGSLFRSPPGNLKGVRNDNYYNFHDGLACSGDPLQGYYSTLVDLMGHANLGEKTVLHLIDGLFGGQGWAGTPEKWNLAPFNGDWPSSLFVSQDAVAIDSVAYDFLVAEWPQNVENSICGVDGAQNYLHEAALADNPPSDTIYDPDGTRLTSLGVHEHWNNPTDKQYTRNLGTGEGIELIWFDPGVDTPPGDFNEDGDVDGSDVSSFAALYANEDPKADLNNDGYTGIADVGKFSEHFGEIPD